MGRGGAFYIEISTDSLLNYSWLERGDDSTIRSGSLKQNFAIVVKHQSFF